MAVNFNKIQIDRDRMAMERERRRRASQAQPIPQIMSAHEPVVNPNANINPFQDNFTPNTNTMSMQQIVGQVAPKIEQPLLERIGRGAANIPIGMAAMAEQVTSDHAGFAKGTAGYLKTWAQRLNPNPTDPATLQARAEWGQQAMTDPVGSTLDAAGVAGTALGLPALGGKIKGFKSIKEARAAINDIGKPKVDVPEVVQEPIRSETPIIEQPISEKILEIGKNIPDSELEKLPRDLSTIGSGAKKKVAESTARRDMEFLKPKETPFGTVWGETRGKDAIYERNRNFVAKNDIPEANISKGDKVSISQGSQDKFHFTIDLPKNRFYTNKDGFLIKRHYKDADFITNNFESVAKQPTTATEVVAKAKPNAVTQGVKQLTPDELTAAQAKLREKFKPMDEAIETSTPPVVKAKKDTPITDTKQLSQRYDDLQKQIDALEDNPNASSRDLDELYRQRDAVGDREFAIFKNDLLNIAQRYGLDGATANRVIKNVYGLDTPLTGLNRVTNEMRSLLTNRDKVRQSIFNELMNRPNAKGVSLSNVESMGSVKGASNKVNDIASGIERDIYDNLIGADSRAGKISTEQPTATVQDAAVRPAQSTKPVELSRDEFNKRYWFHGKGSTHPSFGKSEVTGGVTSNIGEADYYAKGRGDTGEIHIVDKRKLPKESRKELADWLNMVRPKHGQPAKGMVSPLQVNDLNGRAITSDFVVPAGTKDPYQYLVDSGQIKAKYGKQGGESVELGALGTPSAVNQFLTGTSPFNKAWEGVVDKAKSRIGKVIPEKLKQKLAYDSGRPEAWEAAKLARQHNISSGIEETLGLAKAGKEQFTPDTHGKAYDYLDPTERMTAKPTDLTPEQSASLDRMRETQTKLTNEQVELGLLDKDVADANASTYLRRFYDKHEKMDGFLASTFRKYRLKGTGKRYLETPEERMAAGIKRDPFYAFAKSTAAQRHDIETGKLFAKVAESPEFKDLVSDAPKAGFAPKPIPNTWQYGKLRNKYVSQSIYDDIMEIARPWETSEMSQIYGKLLGVWKAGKTAWNPATHGRNIFSSAIQNDVIAGLSPSRVDKYVNAIQGMLKNEPELKQFRDLGGYEGTFNAAELQDFLGKIKTKRGSMMNRGLDYVLEHKMTSPLRAMSRAYQTEEIAFRYAAYKHRLSLGETPEMAMKVAKQAIPDYAQVPDLIRKARRSPIGAPFISYAYKMLPAIAESAIKHPLRAGKYVALTYAMNEFAKSQMGISDEQYNQLRKSKNFNGGSQILLPFTDKAGDPVVMDLTYNLPWGDMLEWGAAAGGTFGQSEGGTGLMDKGLSMLNPIAKSAIEIGGNRNTYTGRDLTTPSMSNMDKGKAIGGQLLNTFAPTFPSRGIPNIIKAAMGEKDYYGKKRDLPTTLARNLAGISVSPINQQAELQGRTMEFKKTLEDYQRRIYNAARKNDKDEVNRLVQEYSNYARTFGSN